MTGQRLLERLRDLERQPRQQPDSQVLELQSIILHVQQLLSTRKGTVPISDDFGMPDVFFSQGINFKESSRRMRESIADVIAKFETRLNRVNVESLSTKEDLLEQRFRIRAVLTRDSSTSFECTVRISSEAKITITPGSDRD